MDLHGLHMKHLGSQEKTSIWWEWGMGVGAKQQDITDVTAALTPIEVDELMDG
jgi:hypothetical protein